MNHLLQALHQLYNRLQLPASHLQAMYQHMQQVYATHKVGHTVFPKVDPNIYALVRMPATYAVIHQVLQEYISLKTMEPRRMVDVGVGTGAGLWAMCDLGWRPQITAVDHAAPMIQTAQELAADSPSQDFWDRVTWQSHASTALPSADLVLMSYMLSEQPEDLWQAALSEAWRATEDTLILIEPGTPAGFARLRAARAWLIQHDAFIGAPCGHTGSCPIAGDDWCHFTVRLTRAPWQRWAKHAVMGYEDEPYCYVVASRTPGAVQGERILRPPQHHTGHIILDVCTPEKIERKIVSKRNKEFYRVARRIKWGATWPKT